MSSADNGTKSLKKTAYLGIDIETEDPYLKDRGKQKARGPSWIFNEGRVLCVGAYNGIEKKAFDGDGGEFIEKVLKNSYATIVGANIQYDIGWLLSSHKMSIDQVKCGFIDVALVESLIDEYQPFDLDSLALKYLNEPKGKSELVAIAEGMGLKGDFRQHLGKLWDEGYQEEIRRYVISDADQPVRIWHEQKKIILAQNLVEAFQMEMNMIPVVISMQQKGVRIDLEKWQSNCDKAREAYDRLKREFEGQYDKVNINSPMQVAALMDRWGVPYKKKITIKGLSLPDRKFTSKDCFKGDELTEHKMILRKQFSGVTVEKGKIVLYLPKIYADRTATEISDLGYEVVCNPVVGKPMYQEHAASYQIVADLVQYKQVKSIVDKFLGPVFGRFIAPDGRVHSTFNIAGARQTNRMSRLAKGTKILTVDGEIAIENIKPGMQVITHTGKIATVKALLYQGIKPCIRLTTSKFRDIICTKDHKFWTGKEWVSASKLEGGMCVSVESLFERCSNLQKNCRDVCSSRKANNERTGCIVSYFRTKCAGCNQIVSYERTKSCGENFENITNKNRTKESDVWEMFGKASKLERSVLRQERSFYCEDRRWKSVCTQKGFCRCFRNKSFRAAAIPSGASHRWKSCEQCFGQFGTCDCKRTQYFTPTVSGKVGYTFVGKLPTFDIALNHRDHSFIANGWLVHNCKFPNNQQIPSKTKLFEKTADEVDLAHMCRECFIPEKGECFVKLDFSGQENRMVAHFADGKNGDYVQKKYNENPYFDEHSYVTEVSGLGAEHGAKVGRKFAKNLRFGVGYGMQKPRMMQNFGWTKEFCDDLYDKVAGAAPWLFEVMDRVQQVVVKRRYIRTLAGRRIHLRKGRDHDAYKYMNYLIQGSAADMTKKATVNIWNTRKNETMLLTVHDENCFSVPMTEAGIERIVELKYWMENSSDLRVPAVCDPEIGPNWADGIEYSPAYGDLREFIRTVFRAMETGHFYELKKSLDNFDKDKESFSEFCENLDMEEEDE